MVEDAKFYASKAIGDHGEDEAGKYLKRKYGKNYFFIFMNSNLEWQLAHHGDILIVSKKDIHNVRSVEVKAGVSYKYEVAVETEDGRNQGWLYTSKADLLIWTKNEFNIMVRYPEFKSWFLNELKYNSSEYIQRKQNLKDLPKISYYYWFDILRLKKDKNPKWILK